MNEKQILQKEKVDIQDGIDKTIQRYLWVRDYINKNSAYTKSECECRLGLIAEREILDRVLRLMDIQDFELKSEWVEIELI